MAENHLFCFGLGYSALALAKRLRREGWRVTGTVRTADKVRALQAEGIDALIFDGSKPVPQATEAFAKVTHVLASIPPDDDGDPAFLHHGQALAEAPHVRWVGYLSTTGVYGDHDGAWVDEDTPRTPTGERGHRRVLAEDQWLGSGLPVHLFRLAGIYGPGRSALDTVLSGRARRIDKPGQVFSRIHVEDIVRVLVASLTQPRPGRAYNVCDDDPAPPADVIAYACELLDRPAPPLIPFAEADLSPMAASFYADNKRVSNARLHDELGVVLAYPTYREGLVALAAQLKDEGL